MTLIGSLLIAVALQAGGQQAPPAAVSGARIKQYMKCVKAELEGLGVVCEKLEIKGQYLHVEYENRGDERDIFVMACVLKLVRPLAGGCEAIELVGKRGGKRLFSLTVPPEAIEQVYAADLTAEEKKRSDELVKRCLEKVGGGKITQRPEGGKGAAEAGGQVAEGGEAVGSVVRAQERAEAVKVAAGAGRQAQEAGAKASRPSVVGETKVARRTAAAKLSEGQKKELARAILRVLAKTGLENVKVGVDGQGRWFVSFENRTYRSDVDAVAAAFKAIGERLPVGPVVLEVTRDAVAVCSIAVDLRDYTKLEAGLMGPEEIARRWEVRPGGKAVSGPVEILAEGNSSFGRVDISFRPWVKYEIGQEQDPWESDIYMFTQADTAVAKGWHLSARWATRMTSGRETVLSKALVRHTRWLGREVLATGSVGKLRQGLYGWYGEVQWDRGKDRIGVVGTALGDELGEAKARFGFGYYEREFGKLGLTTRVGFGKFIESRRQGGLVALVRRFGESTVTMEAVRARGGEEGINFRITVPLGPRKASKPRRVRARISPYFEEGYWSTALAQGDYMEGDHDLRSFRGELTAPYVRAHGERLARLPRERREESWPVAPSWEGTSGLMRIPTADVLPEGWVLTGVSFMDRGHAKVGARTSAMPAFGAIGFLPNLEIVGRFTFFHDVKAYNWPYSMDRSFHIHYRLREQRDGLPAVAIGAQDVRYATRTSYIGRAEYVVSTWRQGRWRLHLGGGRHRLDGVFGGVEYDLTGRHRVHLMAEYDSDYVNVGARVFVGEWGSVDIGTLGASRLCGAVVLRTWLR